MNWMRYRKGGMGWSLHVYNSQLKQLFLLFIVAINTPQMLPTLVGQRDTLGELTYARSTLRTGNVLPQSMLGNR